MNIAEFLKLSEHKLKRAGISSARLDCLILLEDELRRDRGWLLAHPEFEISKSSLQQLDKKIDQRSKHLPLAYIRGFSEFYGRRFMVDRNVLEPRPETETMIELLLDLADQFSSPIIADIGTGSGALAISAKLELPTAKVLAVDIDPKCLKVARKNAKHWRAQIEFYKGDLVSALPAKHQSSIILANLPYVPRNFQINQAAAMEPRLAIDGGVDGLDPYRRLFVQISKQANKPSLVFTESLPPQHQQLAKIAKATSYGLLKTSGLIQVFENEL